MRLHKKHHHMPNQRVHGGRVKNIGKYSENVQKLTKTFDNLLGKRKNTKFALKL